MHCEITKKRINIATETNYIMWEWKSSRRSPKYAVQRNNKYLRQDVQKNSETQMVTIKYELCALHVVCVCVCAIKHRCSLGKMPERRKKCTFFVVFSFPINFNFSFRFVAAVAAAAVATASAHCSYTELCWNSGYVYKLALITDH